jgi:hypothetical protein
MKNKNTTLVLIIQNYKDQLLELMQLDYLTGEQKSEMDHLITALTDLIDARVIYDRFYESY